MATNPSVRERLEARLNDVRGKMVMDVSSMDKLKDKLNDIHNDLRIKNKMYCLMAMKRSGIITEDDFTRNINNIAKRLRIDFKEMNLEEMDDDQF